MLELYQFELSPYSEKVRLILDYKGIPYRKVEVTPGVGQFEVYQLSGQRQVPVLKDDAQVVADSTAIAKYLDRQYPDKPLIPTEPRDRGLCLMMEEWADESIGPAGRKALLIALSRDRDYRTALLPNQTPDLLKNLVGGIPGEVFDFVGAGVGVGSDSLQAAKASLEQDLESLCLLLEDRPYLLGDRPTLADFAVAALSLTVKVPAGPYLDVPAGLRGRGIPGLADNPDYARFFEWRDRLYADYRKPAERAAASGNANGQPTTIDIE